MHFRIYVRFLSLFCFFLLNFSLFSNAQTTPQANDSLMREQLTRAVQVWQTGKVMIAYQTLDSITAQTLTAENAGTKVKAAIWTATYLQQQKKYKPATKFLDSALVWATQYAKGDELKRVYETYAQYHLSTGNTKAAFAAQQAAFTIKDSLTADVNKKSVDSLNAVIADLQLHKAPEVIAVVPEEETASTETDLLKWIFAGVAALLFIVVLMMNGKIQKLKSGNANANHTYKPAKEKEVRVQQTERPAVTETKVDKPLTELLAEKNITTASTAAVVEEPVVKTKDASKEVLSLTARISAVELVLIRSDVFAWKVNGESKTAHKTLQKYVDDFPGLMKSLDDSIAANDADGIIKSLNELSPSLETFGMSGTVAWIKEIETEATEAKVNKLLSRVFQVRNHARRALDEAKAILEKVSL